VQDHGYFGPGSVTWKVARESVLNLGGARAVLMQLAHPLVAMGVSTHSGYMQDPLGRAERTFILGQLLTFGTTPAAQEAARRINRLHTHVSGTLPANAGVYTSGTVYSARNPELLLWVHATLVDTVLLLYPLLIGPLEKEEKEQYYQESKVLARLLGLHPAAMPATVSELEIYIQEMIQSNRLAATPQARQLARQVLFPPLPRLLRPLSLLNLEFTCALLPPPIREIYGLEWNAKRQAMFDLTTRGTRTVLSRIPPHLRALPLTNRLMEQGKVAG
jgi:uncharacterized protein (DUF2236 family)